MPPDDVATLVDLVDCQESEYAGAQLMRFMAHWVSGFGPSVDDVWRRHIEGHLPALQRIRSFSQSRVEHLTVQGMRDFALRCVV